MNNITNKTHVVVTRNLGVFYITEHQSDILKKNQSLPFNHQNRMPSVEIDDVHISSSNIIGIMSASKWSDISREKNGEWKCQSGNWHNKFEKCKCNWGKTNKVVYKDKELTDYQKTRGILIGKLLRSGRKFSKISKMTNRELEELLLK